MTLLPAEAGSGISFRRTDVETAHSIVPAAWDHVVETTLCTTIGNAHGVKVGTVEHLMSALAGCAIDNAAIEIDGPEVPIMDGSAAPFVSLIESAEVVEQPLPRRVIRILQPVRVEDGDRSVSLVPGIGFSMSFEIDFNSSAVSRQSISIGLGNGTFKEEIAGARTFGFLHEVEMLRAAGLARGGSLDNAVVISGDKVLNEGGLRFADEFVRHKVLDAMGDLYLAGAPIIGAFSGICSGHAANNRLLHALFA
jgi:UDP-3-O-[3-hydroxymyristoyl] N-acetylglucosamine deacetylase